MKKIFFSACSPKLLSIYCKNIKYYKSKQERKNLVCAILSSEKSLGKAKHPSNHHRWNRSASKKYICNFQSIFHLRKCPESPWILTVLHQLAACSIPLGLLFRCSQVGIYNNTASYHKHKQFFLHTYLIAIFEIVCIAQ